MAARPYQDAGENNDYSEKITDGLSRLEGILAGSLLAIIVLINFVEIVQRNLLKLSFPWVQELSLILISWVVFFGAAYIYKEGDPAAGGLSVPEAQRARCVCAGRCCGTFLSARCW